MHRHRIAQFSLILSILHLVLAAPIPVQKIHEARHNELVVTEHVPALKKRHAVSDRSTSPRAHPGESSGAGPSTNQVSEGPQELQAERPPSEALPAELPSPLASHSHSDSFTADIPYMPIPDHLREFQLATPHPTGSDQAETEAHPPSEELAPSHQRFFSKKFLKKVGIPVAMVAVTIGLVALEIKGTDQQNY